MSSVTVTSPTVHPNIIDDSFSAVLDAPYICRWLNSLAINIFAPYNSLRTRTVCVKILEKIKGLLGDRTS